MAIQANYTNYAGHSSASIVVSTQAELDAAIASLNSGSGGTILLDGSGGPFKINCNNVGGSNNAILFKSLDPTNLARVQDVDIQNSSYITIDSVEVSSVGTNSVDMQDVNVRWSDHIEITNSTFWSDANGTLDGSPGIIRGGGGALFEDSSNITFSGNTMTGYDGGVGYMNVSGLNLIGNELSHFQGDGFQGGGIQDAVISKNYMHDFYGSAQTLNHTDFIQIWGVNAQLQTSNVEISANILDSNGGASGQGIFIRNEEFSNTGFYSDIRVFDNIVHVADWAGINVSDTQNAQVYGNTVLLDQNAWVLNSPGGALSQGTPWIFLANSPNSSVQDNIAWHINDNGQPPDSSNYIIDYKDPTSSAYYTNHFNGIDMLASSPLYGVVGSTIDTSFASISTTSTPISQPVTQPVVDPGTTGGVQDPDTSGNTTPDDDTTSESNPGVDQGVIVDAMNEEPSVTQEPGDPNVEPIGGKEKANGGKKAANEDDEAGEESWIAKLFQMIFSIFGLGGSDDDTSDVESDPRPSMQPTTRETASAEIIALDDLLPVTGTLDDDAPVGEDEDEPEYAVAV